MIELQLATISDYAYADERNKLFILGEFRYVFGQKLPLTHQRLFLTFRVLGDKVEGYEHQLKIDLTDADGDSIWPSPIEGPVKFQDVGPALVGKMQAQAIIEVGRPKFEAWGDYSFQIFIDGRHVGAVPFTVMKVPGQEKRKTK
jgi:hypothetical protein